jgi:hypothetical protein
LVRSSRTGPRRDWPAGFTPGSWRGLAGK